MQHLEGYTSAIRESLKRSGLALNAVRVFENAKSVRKCVRFGLACVRLHGIVRFVFGSVFVFMFVFMFVFGVRVHVRGPILRNLQILPMGNVRHFRIIRKNDILFLKMHVFREHLMNLCVFC